MMRMLLWKEYREIRWVVPLSVMIQYLIFGYWRVADPEGQSGPVVTLFLTTLTAILLGAWISSKEADRGTLTQLLTLPVSRTAIWSSKLVTLVTAIGFILLATLPLSLGTSGKKIDLEDHTALRVMALILSMPVLGGACGLLAATHCRTPALATFVGGFLLAGLMFLIGEHMQGYWIYAYFLFAILMIGVSTVSFLRDDLFDRGRTLRLLPLRVGVVLVLLVAGLYPYDWLFRNYPFESSLSTLVVDRNRGTVVTSWLLGSWMELSRSTRGAVQSKDFSGEMASKPALAGQPSGPEVAGRGFVIHHSAEHDRWLVWDAERTLGLLAPRAVLKLWSPATGWKGLQEVPTLGGSYFVLASSPASGRVAYVSRTWIDRKRTHRIQVVEPDGSLTLVTESTSLNYSDLIPECAAFLPGTDHLAYTIEGAPGELFLAAGATMKAKSLVFPSLPGREAVKGEALVSDLQASPAIGGLVAGVRVAGGTGPVHFYSISAESFETKFLFSSGEGTWNLAGEGNRKIVFGEKLADRSVVRTYDLIDGTTSEAPVTSPVKGLVVSPGGSRVLLRLGPETFPRYCSLGDIHHSVKGDLSVLRSVLDLSTPGKVLDLHDVGRLDSRVEWFDEDRLVVLSADGDEVRTELRPLPGP